MAHLIERPSLSEAWQAAMEFLLDQGGKAVNLNVAFQADAEADPAYTERIDRFISDKDLRYGDGNLVPVHTVASTLFPSALYHPHLGEQAAPRLYENYALSMRIHRRRRRDKETYFNRLVAYPIAPLKQDPKFEFNEDGTWNQLAFYVDRLRKQAKQGHRSSSYELGLSHPADADLRIQAPYKDKALGSFPCLSHISLTLEGDRVHMNATYRNQTFITRAYGNYVGLVDLLRFIAIESGTQPGEVQVVATHADAELHQDAAAIRALVEAGRA